MATLTLITGGVRSGKSAWALTRADEASYPVKVFIATAQACDDEMARRIDVHRSERGPLWRTIEEPDDVGSAVAALPSDSAAVLDCCTVWLGTVWHRTGGDEGKMDAAVTELVDALDTWRRRTSGALFVVTNEVGWGIVPPDPAVRAYRDAIGRLNQRIARVADEVYLCVAGIAVPIKQQTMGD